MRRQPAATSPRDEVEGKATLQSCYVNCNAWYKSHDPLFGWKPAFALDEYDSK